LAADEACVWAAAQAVWMAQSASAGISIPPMASFPIRVRGMLGSLVWRLFLRPA